jgi:hypothetical protein
MPKSLISMAELKKIPKLPHNLQIGKFLELDQAYKVYKKAYYIKDRIKYHVVITLILPEGTVIFTGEKVLDYFSWKYFPVSKMRANQAVVVRFDLVDSLYIDKKEIQSVTSGFCSNFEYLLNEMVFPDKFSRAYVTCNGGIHFFRTFERAEAY